MIKKHTIILMAAVAGAMTVFATVPQLKITVGEETVTLYPGEEMNFGATDGVTNGVDQVTVNGNTKNLGESAKAEYRHSDAAPKVNGVEFMQSTETSFSGAVSLTKGGKVYFDGIGRAGSLLNKNLRNFFTPSADGEYAVFNGYTGNYGLVLDTENLVGSISKYHAPTGISINGQAVGPFLGYEFQYDGVVVELTKGQTVTFQGVPDLTSALQSHFWDVTSNTEAKFKGKNGSYDLIWDNGQGLLFTELHGWVAYPDMLYVGGKNWGHPGAGYVTAPEWHNLEMKGMMNLNNVEGKKWQCAMYLANGFTFKFGLNHLMDANQYSGKDGIKSKTPEILGVDATWGDFIPGTNFTPGVYMITVDLSALTIAAEKLEVPEKPRPSYFVNEVGMADEGAVYHTIIDNLAKDQIVTFRNFRNLAQVLQPDFWEVIDDNSAKFTGPTGKYDMYYDTIYGVIYTISYDMNATDGTAVWLNGNCWGHPGAAPVVTSTRWDFSYNTCLQMKKVEDGVYETTVYFPANFCAKFYKARDWNQQASTDILTPQPSNMFTKNEYGDFLPGSEFKAGTYTIRVDYNRNIVYAVGYYTPAE